MKNSTIWFFIIVGLILLIISESGTILFVYICGVVVYYAVVKSKKKSQTTYFPLRTKILNNTQQEKIWKAEKRDRDVQQNNRRQIPAHDHSIHRSQRGEQGRIKEQRKRDAGQKRRSPATDKMSMPKAFRPEGAKQILSIERMIDDYRPVFPSVEYSIQEKQITPQPIEKELLLQEKSEEDVEIERFFSSLENQNTLVKTCKSGVFLDDTNYDLFRSFIGQTKEEINILTWRVDEQLLSELLWPLKDKNIAVTIITKNRVNKKYLSTFKKFCSKLTITTLHRNKIHGKFIISDSKSLLLGSSNITDTSISESGRFLECNVLTENKETIWDANNLFMSIKNNNNLMEKIAGSNFLYTRNRHDCLPFILQQYFENESEEILLLFSSDMVDKRIVDRILSWNSKTPIKIYIGDSRTTEKFTLKNLESMRWLYETSIHDYKNVKVIPVTGSIHAKLYLFTSQRTAIVSSLNLTVESWQSLLETAIAIRDFAQFDSIYRKIKSLEKSQLKNIIDEDIEMVPKPESTFSGTALESKMNLPWDLPEMDPSWRIPKEYSPITLRFKKKQEKSINEDEQKIQQYRRINSPKEEKDPFLEDIKKKDLEKASQTPFPKLSHYKLSGKKSDKHDWERQQKTYEKKLQNETSPEEREKIKKGIEYCKKMLK